MYAYDTHERASVLRVFYIFNEMPFDDELFDHNMPLASLSPEVDLRKNIQLRFRGAGNKTVMDQL